MVFQALGDDPAVFLFGWLHRPIKGLVKMFKPKQGGLGLRPPDFRRDLLVWCTGVLGDPPLRHERHVPNSIATALWVAEGEIVSFFGIPYPTRSVIARLENGDL
jgi:hypothetical protein